MVFELDFRSHVPIYLQIVEHFKQRLASGELKPGDQLPTVRQLAADLRVNFNTVARGYRLLDEAGMISTQQGRGTYVLDPLPDQESAQLRRSLLIGQAQSYALEASRLGFTPDEALAAVQRAIARWLEDGEPPDDNR